MVQLFIPVNLKSLSPKKKKEEEEEEEEEKATFESAQFFAQ